MVVPTSLSNYAVSFFSTLNSSFSSFVTKSSSLNPPKYNFRNIKDFIKKFLPLLLLILIVGGILYFTKNTLLSSSKSNDERINIKAPRAQQTLNRSFSYPIKDDKGAEITKLKYILESAELDDEIIVKGQRAIAVKGRTFLILNIKILNSYSKAIDINVRDYVRLSLNGNDKELFAADIHNDPVNVQANSTKAARIGFPINDTDKNLYLLIGEINGTKEKVILSLL